MGDGDANEADALSRLEAALDRIAQRNQRFGATIGAGPVTDQAGVDTVAIAARLDSLIGELRSALATGA